MSAEISVTEVRNALRCPRVFALGRQQRRPVAFPVGASALGATFHRIVEAFARNAGTPPDTFASLAADAAPGRVAHEFRAWVLNGLVRELALHPQLATMPAEVDDLAEALRAFADYMAAELRAFGARPAEAASALFHRAELDVAATVDLPGAASVRIGGRVDAILRRASGEFDVVEYKLTDEANADLDKAQVALYRFLVRKQVGIEAHPTILRFDPRLTQMRIDPAEADRLVEARLRRLLADMMSWATEATSAPPTRRTDLCPVCPVRGACAATYPERLPARDDPPSGGARPRPDPEGTLSNAALSDTAAHTAPLSDQEDALEAAGIERRVLEVLRAMGVPATVVGKPSVGPTLVTLQISAGRGSVQRLDREATDLEHKLVTNHGMQATYEKRGGVRLLQVVRSKPRRVELGPLLQRKAGFLSERPGRLVVGETMDGDVLVADLGSPTCCHLLVAGMTGSGKSVLLRSIVISLAHFHDPSEIQFTLVDPKRVSFSGLVSAIGSHLSDPVCHECEDAVAILEGLVDEMEDRYRTFERAQVQDIDDYNMQAPASKLCRRVVVIDEFQDLVLSKALRPAFEEAVQRLGAKARAAGIHLVLATQRPDAKTVQPGIKANLPGKIALRVESAVNSRIILSEGGAEKLLGKGDMLADLGQGRVRAQGPAA